MGHTEEARAQLETANLIREAYIYCRKWILEAIAYADGEITEESLLDGILCGQYVIWPSQQSVVITQIQQFENIRVLRLFVLGGNLEDALSKREAIFDWAKQMGCKRVKFDGRPGWEKIAQGFGFKKVGIVMNMELE